MNNWFAKPKVFTISNLTLGNTHLGYVAVVSRTFTARPVGHKVIQAVIMVPEEKPSGQVFNIQCSGMFLKTWPDIMKSVHCLKLAVF